MGMLDSKSSVSWFTAAVCLLVCFYYYYFFFNRATVEVEIDVEQPSILKVYWAAPGELFSEKNRAMIRVEPGMRSYSFYLADLGAIERLRFDPFQYEGSGAVGRIEVSQSGYLPITLDLPTASDTNNIAALEENGKLVRVHTDGRDPNFVFETHHQRIPVNWFGELLRYLSICVFIVLAARACGPLQKNYGYVPFLLAVVLSLIVVMASVSKRNAHPDEYVHLQASAYYQNHVLPPAVDSEDIKDSYSVYGVSRLNNGEIYYLLAGKFSNLFSLVHADRLLVLRAFNIFLFGLIFLYTLRSVEARLVALPFLLSPQVWYVFSYCVSDAFGLFLCFLASCELARGNSYVNRVLDTRHDSNPTLPMIVTALLLGMLMLLKINYYPFIILIYAIFFWRWMQNREGRWKIAGRIIACTVIALLIAGLRIGADYYVNGVDRTEKISTMQEERAHHWYKPSTELDRKHISMFMKERGVSLKQMIVRHKWFAHTFETGVGKYGYFTISGGETYYRLVKWCGILFLVIVSGTALVRNDLETRLLALLAAGLGAGLIAASLHRSWTVDFQAQGRYLFPLLPMLGLVTARTFARVNSKLLTLASLHLFLLSFYSFVWIAITAIPKK